LARNIQQWTDEALLAAWRQTGDMELLGTLLSRYTTLLLGVSLKYLKDRALAEDAVQQVFLKCLSAMPKEEIANFKGWLYILTRNHCLQQLRDKTHMTDDRGLAHLHSTETDEAGLWLHEETLQRLEAALEELNEEQRATLTLFYLQKCSYEQIIQRTGYTFMQVKSFIQNGKRNLKNIMLKKTGNRQ